MTSKEVKFGKDLKKLNIYYKSLSYNKRKSMLKKINQIFLQLEKNNIQSLEYYNLRFFYFYKKYFTIRSFLEREVCSLINYK